MRVGLRGLMRVLLRVPCGCVGECHACRAKRADASTSESAMRVG